jgi:DNA-binding transcriptional MerR regulator
LSYMRVKHERGRIHPSAWKRNSRKFGFRVLTLPYGGGSTLGLNIEIANDSRLKIGELARQTGLSIKTIRYYERRGLLEQPPRTQGGHRLYGPEEVARFRFVQRAKLLGLTLEEIKELVELAVRCNEGEIVPRLGEVLETKLKETERKMVELSAFRQNLLYYRERASALLGGMLPTDRYCEDVSFCGCLEAVTGEGGVKL